jgi:hypothetical protein
MMRTAPVIRFSDGPGCGSAQGRVGPVAPRPLDEGVHVDSPPAVGLPV